MRCCAGVPAAVQVVPGRGRFGASCRRQPAAFGGSGSGNCAKNRIGSRSRSHRQVRLAQAAGPGSSSSLNGSDSSSTTSSQAALDCSLRLAAVRAAERQQPLPLFADGYAAALVEAVGAAAAGDGDGTGAADAQRDALATRFLDEQLLKAVTIVNTERDLTQVGPAALLARPHAAHHSLTSLAGLLTSLAARPPPPPCLSCPRRSASAPNCLHLLYTPHSRHVSTAAPRLSPCRSTTRWCWWETRWTRAPTACHGPRAQSSSVWRPPRRTARRRPRCGRSRRACPAAACCAACPPTCSRQTAAALQGRWSGPGSGGTGCRSGCCRCGVLVEH